MSALSLKDEHVAHMREQRHNFKTGVFMLLPSEDNAIFLHKWLNRHNYTLKNDHQGEPTTLHLYVKIMYIENFFCLSWKVPVFELCCCSRICAMCLLSTGWPSCLQRPPNFTVAGFAKSVVVCGVDPRYRPTFIFHTQSLHLVITDREKTLVATAEFKLHSPFALSPAAVHVFLLYTYAIIKNCAENTLLYYVNRGREFNKSKTKWGKRVSVVTWFWYERLNGWVLYPACCMNTIKIECLISQVEHMSILSMGWLSWLAWPNPRWLVTCKKQRSVGSNSDIRAQILLYALYINSKNI